jgi:phage replication initiation protein
MDGKRIRWTLEQSEQQTQEKVRLDWVRFTLPLDALIRVDRALALDLAALAEVDAHARKTVMACRSADADLDYSGALAVAKSGALQLAALVGCFEAGQVEEKGQDFYTVRCPLLFEGAVVGHVLAGGKSKQQASTVHFNLHGEACLHLSPAKFALIRGWIEDSRGYLTRTDLACDVWAGEDVSLLPAMYVDGAFDVRGHRPVDGVAGRWASGHSRTFTVGKRQTGKMLRAYEKGDQLFGHEANDPWVRYEVELRNNARVLDLDLLTRPADFFAGAYDFCAALLDRLEIAASAQRIPAGQKLQDATAEAAVRKVVTYFKRVCAPIFCRLLVAGGDALDFIAESEAHRVPSRLKGFTQVALATAFEKVAAGFAPPVSPSINGA